MIQSENNAVKPDEVIPRKDEMHKIFWFVNAGLLSEVYFEKAIVCISTQSFNINELHFITFIGIKYLIHYMELYTFDSTSLLVYCISNHLKYLQILFNKHRETSAFLNKSYINKTSDVFKKLSSLEKSDYLHRQLCINHIENLCNLFGSRLLIWLKNYKLQAYLFRYGFDPFTSAAFYNSFLIPNDSRYIDPLINMDQKFIDKIEIKCHCKIMLIADYENCVLTPENVTLEVVFDLYKGNYLGFLDMLKFIVKQLNPTNYFLRSLRTVLLEGSCLYNIVTDVPVQNLRYLEKSVIAGLPVSPFLEQNSVSKKLLSVLGILKDVDIQYLIESGEEMMQKVETSKSESEDNSFLFYEKHSTQNELMKLFQNSDFVDYTEKLLKYFESSHKEKYLDYKAKREKKILEDYYKTIDNKTLNKQDIMDFNNIKIEDFIKQDKTLEYGTKVVQNSMSNVLSFHECDASLKLSSDIKNDGTDNNMKTKNWLKYCMKLFLNHDINFGPDKCNKMNNYTIVTSDKSQNDNIVQDESSICTHPRFPWLSSQATKILDANLNNEINCKRFEVKKSKHKSLKAFNHIKSYFQENDVNFNVEQLNKLESYSYHEWTTFCKLGLKFSHCKNDVIILTNSRSILDSFSKQFDEETGHLSTFTMKNLYTLIKIFKYGKLNSQMFKKFINGHNINISIINKVNHCKIDGPTQVGYLNNYLPDYIDNNLSFCIHKIHYDLFLISKSNSDIKLNLLNVHIKKLMKLLTESSDSIRIAFNTLNIIEKLWNIVERNNDGLLCEQDVDNISNELDILHTIIFKSSCRLKDSESRNMIILYHSIQVCGIFSTLEPFLKLPNDERLHSIENQYNCKFILRSESTMLKSHNFFVDIFYDYKNGKFFKSIDAIIKLNDGFESILKFCRTLVLLPTGELWVFPNIQMLKSLFSLENFSIRTPISDDVLI